ncbi:hypothetical protein EGU54_02060 [Achromobacter aegrifaciens]|nr:hypothetical protein EGU54_02060 [Achromobacter aegrifaciens]
MLVLMVLPVRTVAERGAMIDGSVLQSYSACELRIAPQFTDIGIRLPGFDMRDVAFGLKQVLPRPPAVTLGDQLPLRFPGRERLLAILSERFPVCVLEIQDFATASRIYAVHVSAAPESFDCRGQMRMKGTILSFHLNFDELVGSRGR